MKITRLFCLVLISSFLCLLNAAFASDCEIVSTQMFQKQQDVIVTELGSGVPHRRLKTQIYPCANITCRNTWWQARQSTDIEITVTFADLSTQAKKMECEKKSLAPGDEFSCSLCFESDSQISNLVCRFR